MFGSIEGISYVCFFYPHFKVGVCNKLVQSTADSVHTHF